MDVAVALSVQTFVRYWMSTAYACGLLIVERGRHPHTRIRGGAPIYRRWIGQPLRSFFRWHADRGGCTYEEL